MYANELKKIKSGVKSPEIIVPEQTFDTNLIDFEEEDDDHSFIMSKPLLKPGASVGLRGMQLSITTKKKSDMMS